MASVLMVIAPDQFRDEEYAHPRQVLEDRGDIVITASVQPGLCHGKLGMDAYADVSIDDVDARDVDAVVFVGGGGAAIYFDDPDARRLAHDAASAGKILAAICIAPSTLAHAGLLNGVRATAFASQEQDLRAHGAVWTGAEVERDGRIITANGPAAARTFGEAIADALDGPA